MKKHRYRVTLEHLGNPKGEASGDSPLQIEVSIRVGHRIKDGLFYSGNGTV